MILRVISDQDLLLQLDLQGLRGPGHRLLGPEMCSLGPSSKGPFHPGGPGPLASKLGLDLDADGPVSSMLSQSTWSCFGSEE